MDKFFESADIRYQKLNQTNPALSSKYQKIFVGDYFFTNFFHQIERICYEEDPKSGPNLVVLFIWKSFFQINANFEEPY